jgi:fatty-acyl-CoA synthase
MPPTGLEFLLAQPGVGTFDCTSLRFLRIGGAPMAPSRLAEAVAVFGPRIAQTYGQIEAPFLTWLDRASIAAAAAGHHFERLRSCGRPSPGISLSIGGATAAYETGEILVRGAGLPCPYFRQDVQAPASRADDWHATGDVGYVDPDGFVYIAGRQRDVIISGGVNVHAGDVEAAIMALEPVRECAVVGVPDATLGEAVTAVVVLDGARELAERDIVSYCQRLLGKVRAPKTVVFRPHIPRTALGKIDKRELTRQLTPVRTEERASRASPACDT